MDKTIKAIETRYKGYRFRSRLEARWAVYFDAIGMKWEYEKEGYDLGDLGWYLPDFWFPELRLWAEVKPDDFSEIEVAKCLKLQKETQHDVIMLPGLPEAKIYLTPDGDGYGLTPYKQFIWSSWIATDMLPEYYDWLECSIKNQDGCSCHPKDNCRHSDKLIHRAYVPFKYWKEEDKKDATNYISLLISRSALDAARSARFEHGEKP